MIKVTGSKNIICSRNELKMLDSLFLISWLNIYELPLFHIRQLPIKDVHNIKSDYVLVRAGDDVFSESLFKRVNNSWNKLYKNNECKHKKA